MADTRLVRPYISFEDVEDAFRGVFESGILTRGPNVEAFAKELAEYVGGRHAFLTTSATTALSVCLRVLGIGPGDEVVVSDFSFPATANVVEDVGAKPVFADVSPETFNMTPEELERRITPATKAVIFVDAFGNPTGAWRVREICRARGIPMIEDAACAIGSSERGARCGSIADLTCFSFHARKLLTTGEGGAVVTDRDDLSERLRVKLDHGGKPKGKKWDFVDYGYNYRMSELQAVMGRVQLSRLDAVIAHRAEVMREYTRLLAPVGYIPQAIGPAVVHNVQSVVFTVPEGISRDGLIAHLAKSGIESTIGTYCLSGGTYFKKKYRESRPMAAGLEARTVTLPCFKGVDFAKVAGEIASFRG